eukprot:2216499-Rhodomonas_salina.2
MKKKYPIRGLMLYCSLTSMYLALPRIASALPRTDPKTLYQLDQRVVYPRRGLMLYCSLTSMYLRPT